jgi:hypothetical protein
LVSFFIKERGGSEERERGEKKGYPPLVLVEPAEISPVCTLKEVEEENVTGCKFQYW